MQLWQNVDTTSMNVQSDIITSVTFFKNLKCQTNFLGAEQPFLNEYIKIKFRVYSG